MEPRNRRAEASRTRRQKDEDEEDGQANEANRGEKAMSRIVIGPQIAIRPTQGNRHLDVVPDGRRDNQLVTKTIVPHATYDKIKDQ